MEKLHYKAFEQACLEIAKRTEGMNLKNIFGISRGGLVVAVYISHLTGLPIVDKPSGLDTLVVDDIVETGETIRRWENCMTASIYYHQHSIVKPDIWIYEKKKEFIQFPWETEKSAKVDYESKM